MLVYYNNKAIETSEKYTVLQLCSKIGVEIPRFCYHARLSIAANCRMCLIQIEDSTKPIASCAIGLVEGLRFYTNTSLVKKMRESVLEFLLANHPLDCPICDQGGECDLQDQTMVFGTDRGRFYEKKRAVTDFFTGMIIKTYMTRCIHCTRCVRFNTEVERENSLGVLGRGQNTKIGMYIKNSLKSKYSGNLIDICPVGALTSKVSSFIFRPWELRSIYSIDVSESNHSPIRIDFRGSLIIRILPKNTESLKFGWISDKARFLFDGLFYQRLAKTWYYGYSPSWEVSILLISRRNIEDSKIFPLSKFFFSQKRQLYNDVESNILKLMIRCNKTEYQFCKKEKIFNVKDLQFYKNYL